MTPAMIAANGV